MHGRIRAHCQYSPRPGGSTPISQSSGWPQPAGHHMETPMSSFPTQGAPVVAHPFALRLAGLAFAVALGLWPTPAGAQSGGAGAAGSPSSAGAGSGGAPNAGNGGMPSGGGGMDGGAGMTSSGGLSGIGGMPGSAGGGQGGMTAAAGMSTSGG